MPRTCSSPTPRCARRSANALLAIQTNRAKDARTIELSARGQGQRTVRVAYIVEVPVWKASYRLTLAADPAAPRSALQGWATVENLSGQDWKDVDLTLVSGRPVAFRQALYEAYYVKRPEVPIEVAGRLMPGVDRGGVDAQDRMKAAPPPPPPPAPAPYRPQQERGAAAATMAPPPAGAAAADQFEATDAATQVVFRFPRAVSVANGRTLSIPIIDRQMPVQRLALYQAETAPRNPLAAIRITNDGDSGLPAGLITLYERDKAGYVAYVGDARLSGFPVGETRLLAYALDEKIVIERDAAQTDRIATGTIAQGALRLSRVVRQTVTYRVKGPAKEPRQLVIVQRRLPGWTLVKPEPKGVELSEGNYRITFQLPGGDQTQTFEVVQEQTQQQELRLVDGSADQIRVYAQAREFDAKTREALTRILQLQAAVSDAQRKVTQADAERTQIVQEQARLRDNLARVPANSDLQRRYLATLDKQETDLEAIAKRRADAEKARRGGARGAAELRGAARLAGAQVVLHGVVAPEQVEQGAQRRAPLGLQLGIALDDQAGVVARRLQQLAVGREVGQPHVGQAALPGAQQLAGAAQAQILLGDAEAVLGLAHDGEPRLGGLAERLGVEQQAGRLGGAAADAAAQLVELGEAEALGVLDHHHGRGRHVDADLDHGGRDQDRQSSLGERRHGRLALGALQAAVHQADLAGKARAEQAEALLGIGEVDCPRIPRPAGRPSRRAPPVRDLRPTASATSAMRSSGRVRVSIGWRPAGFSVSLETSRSP